MSAVDGGATRLSPDQVRPGYSGERPRSSWLGRIVTVLLLVGLVAAMGEWARLTTPNTSAMTGPPQWDEELPQTVLSAAQQERADAMADYAGAVPVLNYHAVTSREGHGISGPYVTPTAVFAQQMAMLDRAGFTTITLEQLRGFLDGTARMPRKPILLTFDDGHATTLHVVDPILARHGFTAVSFPISGSVPMNDTPSYYMTHRELETLRATGRWEFGSHTHAQHRRTLGEGDTEVSALDHRIKVDGQTETPEAWQQRVEGDLRASRAWFDEHLPVTKGAVDSFAYPYGAHGQGSDVPQAQEHLDAALRANGFTLAFIGQDTTPYRAILPDDDPLLLPRLGMMASTSPSAMLTMIRDALPSAMPAEPAGTRWVGSGASCSSRTTGQKAVVLTLGRDGYAECRMRLNTSRWRDYHLTTRVIGASDDAPASVVVRDGRDWAQAGSLEVQLKGASLLVRERGEGEPRVLAQRRLPAGDADGRRLRIDVQGRKATVAVDGERPLRLTLDREVAGGVTLGVAGREGDRVVFADPRLAGQDASAKGAGQISR